MKPALRQISKQTNKKRETENFLGDPRLILYSRKAQVFTCICPNEKKMLHALVLEWKYRITLFNFRKRDWSETWKLSIIIYFVECVCQLQWHLVATLPSLSMVLESLPSLTVGIVKWLFLLLLSPFQSSCMACPLLFTFLFCIFLQCSLSGASLSNMPSILNVPIFMASELNFMSPALTSLLSSRSIFSHTWWKFYLRPNLSNTQLMDFLLHPLMFLYQSCYPIYSGSRELR